MKRIAITTLIVFSLMLGIISAYLISIRPWQSKVLAHGFSPEGREYCVVQTFRDFVEPYQVSFYVRDPRGVWIWNYLEHEDNGWKSATVNFSGSSALIQRNGMPFKEIDIPSVQVDLSTVLPGYRDQYCDKDFSVEEVFAFHNQKYK